MSMVSSISSHLQLYSMLTAPSLTAIWSATHTLPRPSIPLDFPTRWGGSIYFMAQGVAIILEGAWRAITGRKVQGPLAFVWSVCCMAGLGYYTYLAW